MRYLMQRLFHFAVVFVVVTFLVLVATRIGSTDPLRDLAGGVVSEQRMTEVAGRYSYLDKPLPIQWFYWMGDLFSGDWGHSYQASENVTDMFRNRLPATFFIGFWAIIVGLLIALPVGIYSAYRRDRLFDRVSSVGSFAMISMPPVVIAVALMFLVVVRVDAFPTSAGAQYVAPWSDPVEHFKNFFIPALTLGIGMGAVWSRFLRGDMIFTLQSDFITLARAKGMSARRVLWVHALRSSILSLITSVALQMSALITGTVIVEVFFGPPGLGSRLVIALQQNDLLVLQAITVLFVIVVVGVNLVVDLLYAVVDPRIRAARALT